MNSASFPISSPDSPALQELCQRLDERAQNRDEGQWPAESLKLCSEYGVFSWFIGEDYGGQSWNAKQIAQGYLKLGAACLTTTFIITQRTAATRRLEASENETLKLECLPALSRGELSSTVGISHLTTSRQHTRPALSAEEVDGGFRINGYSPWVTGGNFADRILMGATLEDQRQILFWIEGSQVTAQEPFQLMALTGSSTGVVNVENVFIPSNQIVGGPKPEIMKSATGAKTGGLQTSTLAIALASAAVDFIGNESQSRADLRPTWGEFDQQLNELKRKLLELAVGNPVCNAQELRAEANSLVLRATQSALVAAKGAGYVTGHRVGRWCREAMFFLVWSCPQPVLEANLCELAGVEI